MSQLTVNTVFAAIDKFTKPVKAMEQSTMSFAQKATTATAMAERGFRKLTSPLQKLNQMLGGFGLALGGTLIIGNVITSLKDYESAIASAMAITGKMTKEEFKPYQEQIELTAKITKKSTTDIAKAFEIIGSAKPELLANAEALGLTTKAAITLSKASGDDLQSSAMSLTGVMNQFSLGAENAERVMNVLAAGSVAGSANITNVAESMKNFGSVAASANLSVEESVALVEVLGKFGLFGAEAGTKLRGSILQLQKANLGYASGQFNTNDALVEAQKQMDKLSTAAQKDAYLIKLFGAENVSSGKILLNNIGLFNEYTKSVTGTNTAVEQANVKSNTFTNRLAELQAKWITLITTNQEANRGIGLVTSAIAFLTDNLETIIATTLVFLGVLAAYKIALIGAKIALFAVKIATIAYNVVLGISNALQGKSALYLAGNTIAYKAFRATIFLTTAATSAWNAVLKSVIFVTKLWTTAQYAINVALTANPIGAIIMLVVALIAAIISIIYYWDEWGRAFVAFSGPVGMIINLFQELYENWDMIKKAFEMDGILGGFKALGQVILSGLLYPLQKVLEIVGYLPDWLGGGLATDGAKAIADFRADLTSFEQYQPKPEVINMNNERTRNFVETINNNERQQLDVNFNNMPNGATVQSSGANFVMPKLTPSFNF